jgi:hypothetical protein
MHGGGLNKLEKTGVQILKLFQGVCCAPKLFDKLKCESKVKTTEEQGIGDTLLGSQHLGVKGRAGALGWGLRKVTSIN